MQSDLIYDVGMHTGEDTIYYLQKGFRVIAIEANSDLVSQAYDKFSLYIENKQLIILNVAISDQNGFMSFYKNKMTEFSSLIFDHGTRGNNYKTVCVRCCAFDVLLMKYGTPYYLKVDIEGSDIEVIKRLDRNNLPKFVSLENGNGLILDTLVDLGYSRFKFINQSNWNTWKCPFPPREGDYVNHVFTFGSSGLFGDETDGEWKNIGDTKQIIDDYWLNPNRDPNVDGWFDLHAAL